jgi:aspartate aminotransferase
MFETLNLLPSDPILGLLAEYREDSNPHKVDLGIGVYKNEEGDTPIMEAVKLAEQQSMSQEMTKTYIGPAGDEGFNKSIAGLLFGARHTVITENRLVTVQTPGGCGALRVAAEFIKRCNESVTIWVSDPTWANHMPLLGDAGLNIQQYPYYDYANHSIRFDEMIEQLKSTGPGDIVLLHGCCHNPCGADLNQSQWQVLRDMAVKQGFLPFVDIAYQGLGDSLEADAYGIRLLADAVPELIVASSCSKNFGLYRERIGSVNLVCKNSAEVMASQSQLLSVTRGVYSMPPAHGATIVNAILNEPSLEQLWLAELTEMRDRINNLRRLFVARLREKGVNSDFSFIEAEKGMFSFLGISTAQVQTLKKDYSIYMVDSSRINVAGISRSNIDYLTDALIQVL